MGDCEPTEQGSERFRKSFACAAATAVVGWGALYAVTMSRTGALPPSITLLYNLPISVVFLTLGFELALSLELQALRRSLVRLAPFLAVWLLGLVLLWLRLGRLRINVSGHMAWLSMMLAHAVMRRAPVWLLALVGLVFVECAWFNFVWFHGTSGRNGLLAGVLLAALLLVVERVGLRRG
ncbi:MAG: hypothetical protein HY906_13825 [Deltaproteobacteria bacterium]|nr:hypothetical protein [Deltaproteobacteria bacterium]